MEQIDRLITENLKQMLGAPAFEFEAVISAGTYQIPVLKVLNQSIIEDYVGARFEERVITVVTKPSDYAKVIKYGHSDLTVKLTTKLITGNTVKLYRAILSELRDTTLENNRAETSNMRRMDEVTLSTFTLQLIDPAAYELRMTYADDIFPNTTTIDVLKYLLATTRLVNKLSKQDAVGQLEIDPSFITKKHAAIVIPTGTKLLKVPDLLQSKYGVYSQGLGTYLKNRTWFVFAPYTRLKETVDTWKLVLINVPSNRYRNLDRSYVIRGKTITVLLTGETKHVDNTDYNALVDGTGIRYSDPAKLLEAKGKKDGTSLPKTNPKDTFTEYNAITGYKSNYVNATFSKRGGNAFTSNGAVDASSLAARGGCNISGIWERSIPELLLPGMPVTYITQDGDKLTQLPGILVSAQTITSIPEGGLIETKHHSLTRLTCYLRDK